MATSITRNPSIWANCQSLCVRPAKRCSQSSSTLQHQPRRHQSSYRRQIKRLSVPPAPGFGPSPNAPRPAHVIFNPPASQPNVYHTPLKFLPPSDRRRQIYEQAQQSLYAAQANRIDPSPIAKPGTHLHESTSTLPSSALPQLAMDQKNLPSLAFTPIPKKYHLTETEIAEIRRLRLEDPIKWTRIALAKRFNCSQFFVSLIQKSPAAAQQREAELEEKKLKWGLKRREAREDRSRRRALWGRDA